MPYIDIEKKKANQRARYKEKREAELRDAGIDPSLIPVDQEGKRGLSIRVRRDSSLPIDLVLEMLPKPGESKEDHKRRRNRMKANFYNSRLSPTARAEKNAKVRAAYEKDAQNMRAKRKEAYTKDPERFREYGRKYFLKNKDERLQKLSDWAAANPDRVLRSRRKWAAENKALLASYSSSYRSKLADAAPVWTDWEAIYWLYEAAKQRSLITGAKHVVDHIIPINGDDVSGLHVWWNLKVITETENCRKGNRWSEEDGLAPMQED